MEVDSFNAKLYVPSSYNYACCYTNGDSIYCLRSTNYNSYNTRDIYNTRLGYVRYTDSVYIGNSYNYNCLESSRITHDVWYRVDLANILISYFIIILIPSVLLYMIHKRFRKR